uniref:Uncharacterized protein n=1 Tax=Megaselia scalaris TaxID=36166 RepID=T1GMP0_MEGSC
MQVLRTYLQHIYPQNSDSRLNELLAHIPESSSTSTSTSTSSSSSSTPSANMSSNSSQGEVLTFKPTFFKTEANAKMDDGPPPKIKEEICDDREYTQSILHSHLTAKREYCSAPVVQQQQKMFKKSQSIINRFNNGDDEQHNSSFNGNNCSRKKASAAALSGGGGPGPAVNVNHNDGDNFVVFKTTLPDD